MQAAMDDSVAERGKPPVADPLSGPWQYRREHLARHGRRFRIEMRGRNYFAIRPRGARRRMSADPVHLTGEDPPLALEETEFDGRGTGIDHPDQRSCSCCLHAE
jgi:hypothetical protein